MTPVDVTRLLYMLYQDVESQINRADLKAQITLSTSAIVSAMVVNLGFGFQSATLGSWRAVEWLALLLYSLFMACICGAIAHALAAAFPRSIGHSLEVPEDPNLYFSGHIVLMDPVDYSTRFGQQSNSDVRDRVLWQIHAKSRVLDAKLRHIRAGLKLLPLAMILWVGARVVLVLGYGKLLGT